MTRFFILALFLTLLFPDLSSAKTIHLERFYQEFWCGTEGGKVEVALFDRTRVDCLTDAYAVEVDFARKWAEAIGQALYYGAVTGRKPGILLIIERTAEARYLKRLYLAIEESHLPIRVWLIRPEDIK